MSVDANIEMHIVRASLLINKAFNTEFSRQFKPQQVFSTILPDPRFVSVRDAIW